MKIEYIVDWDREAEEFVVKLAGTRSVAHRGVDLALLFKTLAGSWASWSSEASEVRKIMSED